MTIKVRVDKAECLCQGIDWDADIVELSIDPAQLTNKERSWIADNLKDGSEFSPPVPGFKGICLGDAMDTAFDKRKILLHRPDNA
jgi:hypothetical protein